MAQTSSGRIGRFDQVQLLTTKNIKYISSPIENPTSDGTWLVSGIINDELLISKAQILIRVPATDVLKVVDYEEVMQQLYKQLGSFADG